MGSPFQETGCEEEEEEVEVEVEVKEFLETCKKTIDERSVHFSFFSFFTFASRRSLALRVDHAVNVAMAEPSSGGAVLQFEQLQVRRKEEKQASTLADG